MTRLYSTLPHGGSFLRAFRMINCLTGPGLPTSTHYRLYMKFKKLLWVFTLVACAHVGAAPILVGEFAPANSSTAALHEAIRFEIADYNQVNPDLSLLFGAGNNPSLIDGWNVFLAKTSDTALFGDH